MKPCSTRKCPQPPWTTQEDKQGSAGDQETEWREGDCNGGDELKCQPGRKDSFLILEESASQKWCQYKNRLSELTVPFFPKTRSEGPVGEGKERPRWDTV